MWLSSGLLSVLTLAANPNPGVPHLTAPDALAKTESQIPTEGGMDEKHCVHGWRYERDPLVLSTNAAALRRAKRLQDAEGLITGSKKARAGFFLDFFCSDAAFTPVLEVGAVPSRFEQAAAVLGGWSQDLCGPMQVLVVARAQEHFVGASFDLKHVLSARYTCDDRALSTEQDCAARDECLKKLFADASRQEALKQDLRKALEALVFTP